MPKKETELENLKKDLNKIQSEIGKLENTKDKKIKTLFRWQSFSRPYSKRNTKWFFYSFLIFAIILLIVLFVREFFIIAPLLAIAFVAYVVATVPPEIIENRLTSHGLTTAGHTFIWHELEEFWFSEKGSFIVLNIETNLTWQKRLSLLVNKGDIDKLREILASYISFRETPKTTWLDHLENSLGRLFHKLTS